MYTGIPKLQKNVVDVEVVYYCAYNFPAVVLKLGKDRWGELRNLHAELSNHLKFKVRTSLAYSLHEVGAIVGHEISDRDLIPAFDAFIKDLEEVKIGVITSFFSFLKCISPEKRVEYVEVLRDIQRDSDQNWRYRELLAKQIGTSTDLFLLDHLATEVVPVLIELVSDRISAVRQAAVLQVGKFINALENHELYQEFLQELRYLGLSNTFLERQLYLRICNAIVNVISEQRFKEDFLPLMVSLCKDNVCNVRIILSQFLAQTLTQIESFRFDLKIRSALYILQKDSCKEIQQNLKQIPRKFSRIEKHNTHLLQ
jgi:serine/threonine-protein phosphatase 4 regulatory subunit 1